MRACVRARACVRVCARACVRDMDMCIRRVLIFQILLQTVLYISLLCISFSFSHLHVLFLAPLVFSHTAFSLLRYLHFISPPALHPLPNPPCCSYCLQRALPLFPYCSRMLFSLYQSTESSNLASFLLKDVINENLAKVPSALSTGRDDGVSSAYQCKTIVTCKHTRTWDKSH